MKRRFPYLQLVKESNESLATFAKLILYPGMEFHSKIKWWPGNGVRPNPHEGVDICYYLDFSGSEHCITPELLVPVMADGTVVALCDDYIGRTIFLDHCHDGVRRFISIYAHVIPQNNLSIGKIVGAGDVVATVADTTSRENRVPPHLHISMMHVERKIPVEKLSWEMMCSTNCANLIDPLKMMSIDKVELRTINHWKRRTTHDDT